MNDYKIYRNMIAGGIIAASLIAPFKTTPVSLKYSYNQVAKEKNADILGTYTAYSKVDIIPEDIKNSVLYKNICNKYNVTELTRDTLNNIKKLNIDTYLEDGDYRLIEYLTNLEELSIQNCIFSGTFIKYNLNLKKVLFSNCKISDTKELPNSITEINCNSCISSDNNFVIPYFTSKLNLNNAYINNITLKNPSSLEEFNISSWSILDLNCIKECTNLHTISITFNPNVRNGKVLAELPNLKNITLDEYASTWIDLDTLRAINYKDSSLKELVFSYDITAQEIIENEKQDEDKIAKIILYILKRLELDEKVQSNSELANKYYQNPLSTIKDNKGSYINYATLFQALASRNKIDSYVQFGDDYAWNVYKNKDNRDVIVDIANLELGTIIKSTDKNGDPYWGVSDRTIEDIFEDKQQRYLYYYDINPYVAKAMGNGDYTGIIPRIQPDDKVEIGYINENIIVLNINGNNLFINIDELKIFDAVALITLLSNIIINRCLDKRKKKCLAKVRSVEKGR